MSSGKIPVFLNQWTIGNLLTMVAMAVSVFLAYGDIRTRINVQDTVIAQQQQLLAQKSSTLVELEARTRALELGFSRVDEKLLGLTQQLSRIETLLTKQVP